MLKTKSHKMIVLATVLSLLLYFPAEFKASAAATSIIVVRGPARDAINMQMRKIASDFENKPIKKLIDAGESPQEALKKRREQFQKASQELKFLELRCHESVSEEYIRRVHEEYSSLPPKMRDLLETNNYKIVLAPFMTDIFPDLMGDQPRGWTPGKTYDNVGGAHRPTPGRGGIIALPEKSYDNIWKRDPVLKVYRLEKAATSNISSVGQTISHEIGHALDNLLKISESQDFRNAYDWIIGGLRTTQRNFLAPDVLKELGYFSQNPRQPYDDKAGRQETVAELIAIILGKSSLNPRRQQLMSDRFKPLMDIVRRHIATLLGS